METKEYQRLVNLYLDMVYRVALNGCKNTYDADDVVQDTFLKLLKCRKPFDSDISGINFRCVNISLKGEDVIADGY